MNVLNGVMAQMSDPAQGSNGATGRRQRWMSVLAQSDAAEVARLVANRTAGADWRRLRGPETGLVMVRGRAGGTGQRFNVGEMTVTRCTISLDDGTIGHAWIAGRDRDHAEHAAVLDAMLQREPALEARVVEPLVQVREAARALKARKAAATRVDFFTLVRGED